MSRRARRRRRRRRRRERRRRRRERRRRWLKNAWETVEDVVESGVDAVTNGVEKVVDTVADVVETIGTGIQDGLEFIAERAGGVLGSILRWVGRVVASATSTVAALLKGFYDVILAAAGGIVKIVVALVVFDFEFVLEGLIDIGVGVLGFIVVVVGRWLGFLQTVLVLERDRPLRDVEKRYLEVVFRNSLALYNVRVVEGFSGLFSLSPRAVTIGNRIYLKNNGANRPLMVHECVHCWQYQHFGTSYAGEALGSYIAEYFGGDDPYVWTDGADDGVDWEFLGVEEQAQLIEDIYLDGELVNPTPRATNPKGGGVFYEADRRGWAALFRTATVDRTDYANSAVRSLRDRSSWRLSR